MDILLKNNTGNKNKNSLIDSFVVRTKFFNSIFTDVKSSKFLKGKQNYLIIGQRGAGKTTLLYRLKYAIEDDAILTSILIPIMLAEEQYNLMDLVNLWETLSESLQDCKGFEDLQDKIELLISGVSSDIEEKAFELIEQNLKKENKKLVIFIENVDVFLKKIGSKGQKRLIEVLKGSQYLSLISSSTTYFDSITNAQEPFFNFFKIFQLEGLTKPESKKLLYKLAEQKGELPNIEKILNSHPKRLESLRRLTGGNPRIISYLFHIFLDNENGKAIIDLYKLLDDITFLYKAELDQLSAQQQKIIDVIARNWDAVSTKEISQKTKIDSKHVSSILNILEKNQIIEVVATTTKNNLYRIKDRFLNIWYLMRFGKKKEVENVLWLVRFFDTWCDKSELSERIASHIKDLETGKYDMTAALDMGNVYLSCGNVPHHIKHNLYETTKAILPRQLAKHLVLSDESLASLIKKLIKNKDWDKALAAISEIKSNETKLIFTSFLYIAKADINRAISSLKELFSINQKSELAIIIADLMVGAFKNGNEDYGNELVEFYDFCIKNGDWTAANKLGDFMFLELEDLEEAGKYYNLAIENGNEEKIVRLAEILFLEERFEECEILIKKAIANGSKIKNNLALVYERQKKIDKAIITLEEAISEGEDYALLTLGNCYLKMDNPQYDKAKELFEEALLKGLSVAYALLGKLYLKKEEPKKAIEILSLGVKKQDAEAAHSLAHLYSRKNSWNKAEDLFLKSAKWGRESSVLCLSKIVFEQNKNDRKEFALQLLEENIAMIQKQPRATLLYCNYLLWNNQVDKSIAIIKNEIEFLVNFLSQNEIDESHDLIEDLIKFFVFLISKNELEKAYELFTICDNKLKDILKPVYYSLLTMMKDIFPNEHLKAGKELKETIVEITNEIKKIKLKYA